MPTSSISFSERAPESGETKFFLGPQAGEKLPSFSAFGVRGKLEGKEFDPSARAEGKPHVVLFTRGAQGGRVQLY